MSSPSDFAVSREQRILEECLAQSRDRRQFSVDRAAEWCRMPVEPVGIANEASRERSGRGRGIISEFGLSRVRCAVRCLQAVYLRLY